MDLQVTFNQWFGFVVVIGILLGIDLWRAYRHPHVISVKEALLTSAGWILLALLFNGWIYLTFGRQAAFDFFTGYLVEKSLSIDNLFIFLLIFSHFKVPASAQHQVLFYGVLGAIIMRALMIWGGIALIEHFDWIFYIFGLFLIFTGIHLALKKESEEELEQSLTYRGLQKWIPFTGYHGTSFFIQKDGRWLATPLFAALVLIETTDLIFALDSVPAILGITTEPFIVFTSNIFAILGLRSLFFALENLIKTFYLLHYALAVILVFIGVKMVLANFFHVPTWATFAVLVVSLTVALLGSILYPQTSSKI